MMPNMCGRFTLQIPPELLAEIFGLAEIPVFRVSPGAASRFNIAPTQSIAVVRQDADHQNRLDMLRWGLIPSWSKETKPGAPLINARSETVAEKPTFRHSIRCRRCLIPASGFFEWRREGTLKVPEYIRLKDGSPMVFAGIWDGWKTPGGEMVESCAILTTTSNTLVAPLHDRQPVILHPGEYSQWLDRHNTDPEGLKALYRPYPADLMEMFPVSMLVNSVKNEGPDLIEPC